MATLACKAPTPAARRAPQALLIGPPQSQPIGHRASAPRLVKPADFAGSRSAGGGLPVASKHTLHTMLATAFTGARLSAARSSIVGQRVEQRACSTVAAPASFCVEAAHKKGSGSTKNGRLEREGLKQQETCGNAPASVVAASRGRQAACRRDRQHRVTSAPWQHCCSGRVAGADTA